MILTSQNNPLQIARIPVGSRGGAIGITFAPGKTQRDGASGDHRRDLATDLEAIAAWGAAALVTLVEPEELVALGIGEIGSQAALRHMEWHHWPIADFHPPGAAFLAAWPERSAAVRRLLGCGFSVHIHCKGGLGRAGMVAARLLVESGQAPERAIAAVRAARPRAIETAEQLAWVRAGTRAPAPIRCTAAARQRDRALGALLGLATGDAIGATLEFRPKPRHVVVAGMEGGGPHRLQKGQWTDDTAMAICLGESLLAAPGLDAHDLMRRFLAWRDEGACSCTGTCFDIGIQTADALEHYRRTHDPIAGRTDDAKSGNGALMRIAPVAIRHWHDPALLDLVAEAQTRATHGSPQTIAASRAMARLLSAAIAGQPVSELLDSVEARGLHDWHGLHRDAIEGSGWVVRSFQAALWAVARTTSFRSAVLLAANLGDDADTTAAIAGQLAGAIYGASAVPIEWLDVLAWRERLQALGGRLFDAASLRPRLQALADFAPALAGAGGRFAEAVPARVEDGMVVPGRIEPGPALDAFHRMAYDHGWVTSFDWARWRGTARGASLMQDPAATATADVQELACIVTACIRGDRFCEGTLVDAANRGLLARVAYRAAALLEAGAAPLARASDGASR